MKVTDNTKELWKLTSLIANEASEEDIVEKAREIKNRLTTTWQEIMKVVTTVDGLVANFAPNQEWQQGLVYLTGNMPTQLYKPSTPKLPAPRIAAPKNARTDVVVRIANELSKGQPINTKLILARLRAEGEQRPDRSVEVSIGNILTRRGWKKVRTGEYAPPVETEIKNENNANGEPISQ